MPRRGRKRRVRAYHCEYPPCIHVVYDERRKIYRVFIEFDDENIYTFDEEQVLGACSLIEWLKNEGYRLADEAESDFLARRYLGANPAEEW